MTAQRGNFATDSVTTADGTVELEFGTLSRPSSVTDDIVQVKYGAGPRTELFVQNFVYHTETRHGRTDLRGRNDLEIGFRHRFYERPRANGGTSFADSIHAIGWQVFVTPDDGDRGVGAGDDALFVSGILDGTAETFAWTLFYELGVLDEPGGSGQDLQHAASVIVGRPVRDGVDAYAELFGWATHERSDYPLAAQVGVAWTQTEHVIWDLGVQTGLNDDGGETLLVAGVTWNLSSLAP